MYDLCGADLLIIIGTSLVVHPFASLASLVPQTCPRVLINLDPVGDIGERSDDVVILGKCDDVIQRLCKLLNWEEELDILWEATKDSLDLEETPEHPPSPLNVELEVQKLADEVEKSLELSNKLKESVGKIDRENEAETSRPDNEDHVLSQAVINETGPQGTVATEITGDADRKETDKQDTDVESSGRPDTSREPDAGEPED